MRTLRRWIAAVLRPKWDRGGTGYTRIHFPLAYCLLPLLLLMCLVLWPGCASTSRSGNQAGPQPIIRALIFESQAQVLIDATEAPTFTAGGDGAGPRRLNLTAGTPYPVTLAADGWRVGGTVVGAAGGDLVLTPAGPESFRINGKRFRGEYRLIAAGAGRFHVVNHIGIDDYLRGVLAKELFPGWHEETYRALAIAARSYTLYVVQEESPRHRRPWDVYADTKSQVYGGYDAETAKSRKAVEETAGIVVGAGSGNEGRLFKAYYSACCGGVSQASVDAFGGPAVEQLSEQNVQALCNASPKFNWGPITIRKEELTHRFKQWGVAKGRAEKNVALITKVEVQQTNRFGRPVRFTVTDKAGKRYSLSGEEFRWACNTEAQEGTTLNSSFVTVINDSDSIRFVDGHGWGHGVGLCQWCTEARARAGMLHEDIVLAAYPKARLFRAY